MLFRNREKDPKTMIRIGMLALATSIIIPWFVTVRGSFAEGFVDGLRGVLLGMALALLIWGAKLGGFNRRTAGK
jgi:hypothetical protein